jgi:hypothetical protein
MKMARFVAAIRRAMSAPATRDRVHFHAGPAGPYVCENPRCVSPGLDPDRS